MNLGSVAARVRSGQPVTFRAVGNSMTPRISSGAEVIADELRLIGQRTVEGWNAAYEIEGGLHRRFAKDRLRGEWFKPTHRLLRTIAKVADPPRTLIQSAHNPPPPETWDERAARIRLLVSGPRETA